jgi:hypothetical protein
LITALFATAFAASVLAQSVQSNVPSSLGSIEVLTVNSTLASSAPPLAPLKIPSIPVADNGPEPTLPPFDPAKVPPCNMTQVRAEMAANPRSDENHYGATPSK